MTPLGKVGLVAVMAVYVAACLEFAAGRIAPAAENHSARKRLLALAIAAAWAVVGLGGDPNANIAILFTTAPLLAAYTIGAIVERPAHLATVFAPFARRGPPGRLAAFLLAPGWATGLVFVAVVWALSMCGWLGFVFRQSTPYERDLVLRTTVGFLVAATIVFPLPLLVYLPRARLPLLLYALVQLVCFVGGGSAGVTWSGSRRWEDAWTWTLVLPFPLAGLLSFVSLEYGARMEALSPYFRLAAVVTAVVVLWAVALPWVREMRALGRRLAAARAPGRG